MIIYYDNATKYICKLFGCEAIMNRHAQIRKIGLSIHHITQGCTIFCTFYTILINVTH